jgi:protein-disulfide isomerase
MGDESHTAAKAGICAADQGKFWEMHDWMFANQPTIPNSGDFNEDRLVELATSAGLDADSFRSCLGAGTTQERLLADLNMRDEASVQSTPSFLVGTQLVEGNDIPGLRERLDAPPTG